MRRSLTLAAAHKAHRLAQARAALAMPAPNPLARETVAAFMHRVARIDIERCRFCSHGRLRLVRQCPPNHPARCALSAHARPHSVALPQAP
jgi:hypothetical protein